MKASWINVLGKRKMQCDTAGEALNVNLNSLDFMRPEFEREKSYILSVF